MKREDAHSRRDADLLHCCSTVAIVGCCNSLLHCFALAAGSSSLTLLPEPVLELILCRLQQADLASTRLSCNLLARLASRRVSSVSRTKLSHRELARVLPTFSCLQHLQLGDTLSGRCAAALQQIRTLSISGQAHPQSLSSLSSLTNLLALRVVGPVKDLRDLSCLLTLTKLCLPSEIVHTAALAFLTRLQSFEAWHLNSEGALFGQQGKSCSELQSGLTSLCLPYQQEVTISLGALVKLTGLQMLRGGFATHDIAALSCCENLHTLQLEDSYCLPACAQLTFIAWSCHYTHVRELPTLLSYSRLKEFICFMCSDNRVTIPGSVFPVSLTSLWFSGGLEVTSLGHLQMALSKLLDLRVLGLMLRGGAAFTARCTPATLLHDIVAFTVAFGAAPLIACDIQIVGEDSHDVLQKGDVDSLLSWPSFADIWDTLARH